MKKNLLYFLLIVIYGTNGCKKDSANNPPLPEEPIYKVTSAEFVDDLLFVNKNDFKILTSHPAEFFSGNPQIKISSDGVISRITSGEVVPIEITWIETGLKTIIYGLGATDNNHDEPYASYHGVLATNPYSSYLMGWKTLSKLPVANETFALIMRHGDADSGKDLNSESNIAEWWKSCDPRLARQLNERGKLRSAEMGKILKDLNYPVSRVITSEFCRSVSTARLINAGPSIKTDSRINHSSYKTYNKGSMIAMTEIMKEQPVDNKMTLMVLHHPANETGPAGYPTFPAVSPFTWGGSILVSVSSDKTIRFQGAVSYSMMEYFRNIKLKTL